MHMYIKVKDVRKGDRLLHEQLNEVLKVLSRSLSKELSACLLSENSVEEIRLRINRPVFVLCKGKEKYLTKFNELKPSNTLQNPRIVTKDDLVESLNYISRYSRYACEEEIRQGFFTIQGGHRIGIGGQVIVEKEQVRSFKQITFLTIRIAHEIKGCASFLLPYLYEDGHFLHTLIAAGPGNGKTTLLRDLIRQISNGNDEHTGVNVGVVDERSEIGASFLGVPQNDVGIRTDILDACPKVVGIKMLLRTMNPAVIAVDEIGTLKDLEAIYQIIGCGCTILATAHSRMDNHLFLHTILEGKKLFERIVMLGNRENNEQIVSIYNGKGENLYRRVMHW